MIRHNVFIIPRKPLFEVIFALLCLIFFNSTTLAEPQKKASTTATRKPEAGAVLPEGTPESGWFTQEEIPDEVFRRMEGRSFGKGCTTKRSDLRYLRLLHRNREGRIQVGEMVCNRLIADDLTDIFRQLYAAGYRIERMVLTDNYGANDELSMQANNTSCFNFRPITGSKSVISLHGKGLAVDINPLYNPYISRKGKIQPKGGEAYAYHREKTSQGGTLPKGFLIMQGDLCHQLFLAHGFQWGGAWKNSKDYQHFEKKSR